MKQGQNSVSAIVNKFTNIYENIKRDAFQLYKKNRMEECLETILVLSTFAWWYHFGYWYDEELEEIIEDIGFRLLKDKVSIAESLKSDMNSVLFLTTHLTDSGGHTEAMKFWINCLSDIFKNIYLVSTEAYCKTFKNISDIGVNEKVEYIKLTENKYTDKILKLANILIQVKPSYIFLFVDPNDIVSLAALGYLKTKMNTRIIFFNHSDHTFWIGKRFIDILVEFRSYSIGISRVFRGFEGKIVVVPLTTQIHNNIMNTNVKLTLPLKLDKDHNTVSLSIGAPWKFVSDGYWDYFKVVKNILRNAENHIHILITKKDKYIERNFSEFPRELKNRFKIMYDVSNPLPYYKVSDFIIESFPVIGGTVRLEAMALGKPVIFIKNNKSGLFSVTDVIPPSYRYIASNNKEVIQHAEVLLKNREEREKAGKLLKRYFDENFAPEKVCMIIKSLLNGKNEIYFRNQDKLSFNIYEDNKYLFYHDFTYKGFINPYLILLKVYLDKRRMSISSYLSALKKLSFNDFVLVFKKLISKI